MSAFKRHKNCVEAYEKGLAWRKCLTMQSGSLYKIKEGQTFLNALPDNLINIGHCAHGDKDACRRLVHCLPEEKAYYVKNLPLNIAETLGNEVIGVLYALKDDGLSAQELTFITNYADAHIDQLIDLGESTYHSIQGPFKSIINDLRDGTGELHEFVFSANFFVNRIVWEAESCKK